MFLHLSTPAGGVLYSTVPAACLSCMASRTKVIEKIKCPGTGGIRRRAHRTSERGTVYFCGDEDPILYSRRIVRERLRLYEDLLPQLEHIQGQIRHGLGTVTKRLVHNVITQNAHAIQEIYAIVPQDSLSLSRVEQIDIVRQRIEQNPIEAAKAFLRINKNNFAMKCEFIAFNMLHGGMKPNLHKRMHEIHKVLMNALHLFIQDFKDKSVRVEVDQCDSKVEFDYESVQVALYHMIDNAQKYILPNSRLDISFPVTGEKQRVLFEMLSMQITDMDAQRMFDDGYSGQLPRTLKQAGAGLGLGIIRDLLKLNNASIEISRNTDPSVAVSATLGRYEQNRCEIVLGRPMTTRRSTST